MVYDPEDPDFGTLWVRTYKDGWMADMKVNENRVARGEGPSLVECLRSLVDNLEAVEPDNIDFFITGAVRPSASTGEGTEA